MIIKIVPHIFLINGNVLSCLVNDPFINAVNIVTMTMIKVVRKINIKETAIISIFIYIGISGLKATVRGDSVANERSAQSA